MIDKNMSIGDLVKKHPETMQVFEQHGLGCIGCQAALFENIEQGAEVHGVDINGLINDLNRAVAKKL